MIRAARPGDERAIHAVHARCIGDAFAGKYFPPEEERAERQRWWAGPIGSPGFRHALLVAERIGRVVGIVAVGPSRNPLAGGSVGELRVVLLDVGERGSGVGSALVAAGERAMFRSGFSVATLWVLPENTQAVCCYKRCGWHADGAERVDSFGGREITSVRYEKRLAS